MIRRNRITLRQIRNCPRQLQHPVKRPRRQMQLLHRRLQQLLRRRLYTAELAYLRRTHLRIARRLRPYEALKLAFTGRLHVLTDGF